MFSIPKKPRDFLMDSSSMDDVFLAKCEQLNLKEKIDDLKVAQCDLQKFSCKEIIEFIDTLVQKFVANENKFLNRYAPLGISFLLNFLRKQNLERIVEVSFQGKTEYLDDFHDSSFLTKKLMVVPRGIAVHWLAGNVPILGMISFIQGLLTKNINIVKLPKENGLVLPSLLSEFKNHTIETANGKLTGMKILNTVEFVYCNRDDKQSQHLLSETADVRVAWGGKEAVDSVLRLPKKYYCEDIIFGPKYSFVVVAKNSLNEKNIEEVAFKLAMDASIFEQRGCNSPHTVFVETGGEVSPIEFAKTLARGMEKALKRIPKSKVSGAEAISIANIRAEYMFSGEAFCSAGTEWTVLYSEEEELAKQCYSRVLFVRPISDINNVIDLINYNHQTLGVCINDGRENVFCREVAKKGISRIVNIGKMAFFEYPWDGLFPLQKFGRWVSRD
jgi:hypothetical protein